ncbi:MAG: hypothetical protein ACI8T1_004182 [Verrucomicrobiales bacterium]|jgi:hypothetical protein
MRFKGSRSIILSPHDPVSILCRRHNFICESTNSTQTMMTDLLTHALQAAAIGQIALAILNFTLPTMLGWHGELAKLSQLPREVFHVHSWFISITVALFGVLTWRFAHDFATGSSVIGTWLAKGDGIFWAIRLVIHFFLTFICGGWAAVYLLGGRLG